MESAPIYITPRKKTPTWPWGQCGGPVAPPLIRRCRSPGQSFARRAAFNRSSDVLLYEKWGWEATLYDGAE